MIRAVQLYTFLDYCNESDLEKEVLECGAGVGEGWEPLLVRFYESGYAAHGIDNSDERLTAATNYCQERGMSVDLRKGDMRQLPFADGSMSFVYSYNAIFHMCKSDIAIALTEIERVLKPEGLCFINFLSTDDQQYGEGAERGSGEFIQIEAGEQTLHSFYKDDDADACLKGFTILYKEKRKLARLFDDGINVQGFMDYIVQKRHLAQ